MNSYENVSTGVRCHLSSLGVADIYVVRCADHKYIVSSLFKLCLKFERDLQIQLVFAESRITPVGTGTYFLLHCRGTRTDRLSAGVLMTLVSGVDRDRELFFLADGYRCKPEFLRVRVINRINLNVRSRSR